MAKEMLLEGLNPAVAGRISPFIAEIARDYSGNIHSVHIVGSAVTPDFKEKTSVIHSVIILNKMDFGFIRYIASLGKKYRKKGIAAPLIMTPDYIKSSLDVFPVEFHDFRLIHKTVLGEDILGGLPIEPEHLKLQCEREVKARLVGLRQSYISSLGEKGLLVDFLSQSVVGCMPLLRAVIYLHGKEPPVKRHDAIRTLQEMTSINAGIFEKLLLLRAGAVKLSGEELHKTFEQYYEVLESIDKIIDELQP